MFIVNKRRKEKIKCIYIYNNKWSLGSIENDLYAFQHIVDGAIDIVTRKIGNKEYDFIINDEGRLLDKPPSIMFDRTNEDLCGNVIITNFDKKTGQQASLSDEDVEYIKKHLIIRQLITRGFVDVYCFI